MTTSSKNSQFAIRNSELSHRGSALLIVLGMIAFMVISAVAFSAFMRHSRLPSSYLRRTSYSRLLAKAALAEAIDLIDVSIGDNPHPGVGTRAFSYPRRNTQNEVAVSRQRNYWKHNVFIGTNQLVNAANTVSTLTLEGLAYLPPALINEVRYYSRHSAAAVWHNLGFDSGRYAFTAVDVSDHFDINRIAANVGRSSSDAGRISLAYAFENEEHKGYTVKPSAWDTFMDEFVQATKAIDHGGNAMSETDTAKMPLVSLADLNLSINFMRKEWMENMSPFCRYIESKGEADFVRSTTGSDNEMMRNMLFVTDGYYPNQPSGGGDDADYDLNDEKYQPFRRSDLESVAGSCATPMTYSSDGVTRLYDSLCGLGLIGLWDYLDTDNVPLSLAVPTVERVPMVCAVEPKFGTAKLTFSEKNADDGQPEHVRVVSGGGEDAKERIVQCTFEYRLDGSQFTAGIMGGQIKVLYAFPFLRDDDANDDFKVGGKVSLFFSDKDMTLRTGNQSDVLHLVQNDLGKTSVENPASGVFNISLRERDLTFSNVKDEESALNDTITFNLSDTGAATKFASWLNGNPVFRVTKQWKQTPVRDDEGKIIDWTPNVQNIPDDAAIVEPTACNLPPLLANGSVNGDFTSFSKFKGVAGGTGPEVTLRMCVWLYVRNSEGKVVDLVPACMKDDDLLLSKNNFNLMGPDGTRIGGTPYPLMMFSGASLSYAPNSVKTVSGQDTGLAGLSAYMCADPRWNWAPEHWFAMSGGFSKQSWLDACQRDTAGRDCDIFMATSDAGYLQSVYELAFLPRLTSLESSGSSLGNTEAVGDGRSALAGNFNDTRNRDFMWRTYAPFADNGKGRDDFAGVGFTSAGQGPRVNPYSGSETALMAALANTPTSWMVASTNENAEASVPKSERDAETFNKNHCFNMMGPTESWFEWDDLKNIAANMKKAMRRGDGDWEEGYRELDWANESDERIFAGAKLSNKTCDLYDVDRKFLYGYWHDAFAPKQQLFLIFVRAEPMMMGGGAIGQTPPQLGARAVALVWRDPMKRGSQDGDPHSTRVLFYRQFD